MTRSPDKQHVALFLATSGHSGVDRIMTNLITELGHRGIHVDLLRIEGHGPFETHFPAPVRIITFPCRHVNSALPYLIRYLRRSPPMALLTDKDRVNRIAIIATRLAGYEGRLLVRVGTTVSNNLRRRRASHRLAQRFSIRHLYPYSDGVLVPSRGAAEDIQRIGKFPDGFVHVVPSPVLSARLTNLATEQLDHPWFQKGEVPVVLGVGELCGRKDFATLIRAFHLLRLKRPCRLVILGKGRKRAHLERLASTLGVSNDVCLPGFVENPYPFLSKASVFALSSTCEGLPVVLLEALALGTPVVSTDCPSGPREILGKAGGEFLVPVGKPSIMAAKIDQVMRNPPSPGFLRGLVERYSVSEATDEYLRAMEYSIFRASQ